MWKARWVSLGFAALVAAGLPRALADPPTSRPTTQSARTRPRQQVDIPAGHLDELKAFLKEYMPEAREQIEHLQKEHPAQARRQLYRLYRFWWRVRHYPPEVRRAAVEARRLERSIYGTVRELRQAETGAEKSGLKGELAELLGRHFDQDQIVKGYRVQHLTRQLAELKADVEHRRKNRPGVIDERLAGLLGPPASQPAASRPSPRRRRGVAISPQRQAELMRFLKDHAPDLHGQLERLQKQDPEQARRMLVGAYRLWRQVRGYPPEVRDAAIAGRRLNVTVKEAVGTFRKSKDAAEKAKLHRSLREFVGRQFDHGQVVREYRVKHLARQVVELKAELARRRHGRAKIISDWLDRLMQTPLATQPAVAPAAASAR